MFTENCCQKTNENKTASCHTNPNGQGNCSNENWNPDLTCDRETGLCVEMRGTRDRKLGNASNLHIPVATNKLVI